MTDVRSAPLTRLATGLPSWSLTPIQRDDVDLLMSGGYAPLDGFLTRAELESVSRRRALPDGTPWPTPITLTLPRSSAEAAQTAGRVALRDGDGTLLAVMTVSDVWVQDRRWHVAGPVEGLRTSDRWDFAELRASIAEIRELVGRGAVLAAQPVTAVDERTAARWTRTSERLGARLLVFPPVAGDPNRHDVARIRGYRALMHHLPPSACLRLLPSGRPATDPAAAALHGVVARNAGATHLLLDEHHGSRDLVATTGLRPVDPADFASDLDPPSGRLHVDVAREMRRSRPPRAEQGFVILLTGLSGSGKSTIAKVLRARLHETDARQVSVLDGDLVRRLLSSDLGFSREDRDLNVRRIGYVASEIAKHGGIAICAPIAPYDRARREVREMVAASGGGFLLVHVATPLAICERRDPKGLYSLARRGGLMGFTGLDDPYEEPLDADVTVDTSALTPGDAAETIIARLEADGWCRP